MRQFRVVTVLLYLCSFPVHVLAQQQTPVTDAALLSILDGKAFEGMIGLEGEQGKIAEVVEFRDGLFVSAECERRCGYARSEYWFRYDEESIHFRTRTYCDRADAWIDWTGTIIGQNISGQLKWTSERWYWTSEKEFWFQGSLVDSQASNALP